jgi:hypothetical protein
MLINPDLPGSGQSNEVWVAPNQPSMTGFEKKSPFVLSVRGQLCFFS